MRHCLRVLFILFLLESSTYAAATMKELSGDHFLVYYEAHEKIARDVLHQSERHYSRIMRNLGYDQLEKPWLGDRRCKIKVYKDKASFQPSAQNVGWAEGMTNFAAREIYIYENATDLFSSVLPHELAHMIFRDIVGFSENIPLWLDEGVALSQEDHRREGFYPIAKDAFSSGTAMPFEEMFRLRSATELDDAKASVFYALSMVTLNYLLDNFHKKKFVLFCANLKAGMTVEEDLKRVYGNDRIGSVKELEAKVKKSLK